MVIPRRRFGTTHPSHFLGPRRWDRYIVPKRRYCWAQNYQSAVRNIPKQRRPHTRCILISQRNLRNLCLNFWFSVL